MAALDHIRVLDLSRVLAGPWSTQVLADLGAEVIKVEKPGCGDDTRSWGPPWFNTEDGRESAYYLCTNRGKKSVCIDITTDEGQAQLRSLAVEADVLVENFKAGATAKYGLDYESLAAINPRLVYCSITGFGQTGPLCNQGGYDFMIQAMGGLMSITGEADEKPGGGPQKVGVAVTDILTGLYATIGILAALTERDKSGLGQHIDLALLDVTAACLANQASNYLLGGMLPARMGNAHPNIVPYQSFATADEQLVIAVGNDRQFEQLCRVLNLPELAVDERYRTNSDRVAAREELCAIIAQRMLTKTRGEWLAALQAAQVPVSPINNVEDVFNHPQVLARGMRVSVPHASGASVEMAGNPLKFSRTPVEYDEAAPLLGQHTKEVLS
jgi:crotonobetainyl-CoA:carnitine CoA-transferase CaiB-like acyl-CoA transferase